MEDNKVVFVVPESVLDMVFVDNVVLAHILAADKLDAGAPEVAGQAFGISNGGPPISVGDFYMSLQKFFPSMTFAYMPRGVTKCICTVVSALQGMLGARCPDLGEVSRHHCRPFSAVRQQPWQSPLCRPLQTRARFPWLPTLRLPFLFCAWPALSDATARNPTCRLAC